MGEAQPVYMGFELTEVALEDDFECLGAYNLNDASSSITNLSSDDDWSIVDGDVGDVPSSASIHHRVEDDVGHQQDSSLSTSVQDCSSLIKQLDEDLMPEGLLANTQSSTDTEKSGENCEKPPHTKLCDFDESSLGDNFIFQDDSARELLLECVELVGECGHEKENQDDGLFESVCSDDQTLFPCVEMSSDSEWEDGVENTDGRGEVYIEDEMSSTQIEIQEFGNKEANQEIALGNKIEDTEKDQQADQLMLEDEIHEEHETQDGSPYSRSNSEDCCCCHCLTCCCCDKMDLETQIEIQCNDPDSFLPDNDSYDFFPTKFCPLKFDRYGSRHRKNQQRLILSDKYWTKMYYYN